MDAKGWWTSQLGAFFFANIGDTDGLCSKSLVAPAPPEKNENGTIFDHSSERYLDECHNASDNVLRNPEYLAPLRTLANCKGLSDTATVHVEDDDAAAKFRIFFKQDDDNWIYIAANHTFSAQGIKKGLELGIDARDVRRSTWDGRVQVHFTVRSAGNGVRDHVALRVAPVLTHHHGQRTERTITTAGRWNDSQARFVAEFQQNVARAGINEPVFLFTDDDIWTPDSFEPGYTSIPGPNGPIILRIMINSIRSHQDAGHKIFTRLRSAGVGAVQQLGEGGTLDATGNLETVPPHTFNNVSYLAGCVIMGTFKSKKPLMLPFLNAQETQKRIELDTDWLSVGHVDEFLQFLPVDNEHGWVLMADDPIAGLETSRKLLRVMPLLWQFRGRVFPVSQMSCVFPMEPSQMCLSSKTSLKSHITSLSESSIISTFLNVRPGFKTKTFSAFLPFFTITTLEASNVAIMARATRRQQPSW